MKPPDIMHVISDMHDLARETADHHYPMQIHYDIAGNRLIVPESDLKFISECIGVEE